MGELSPHRVQHRCADARFPGACPQNVRETDIATSTATLYHNVFRERVNQGHLAPGVSAFGLRLAGFGSRVSSFGVRVRVGQKEGDLGERVRERGGLGVHCNRLVHPSYRGTGLQTPKPVSALQITSQKTKNERKETWGSGSGSSRRERERERGACSTNSGCGSEGTWGRGSGSEVALVYTAMASLTLPSAFSETPRLTYVPAGRVEGWGLGVGVEG